MLTQHLGPCCSNTYILSLNNTACNLFNASYLEIHHNSLHIHHPPTDETMLLYTVFLKTHTMTDYMLRKSAV